MTSVLVADIGGTNARFALASRVDGRIAVAGIRVYPTEGGTFEARLAAYLAEVSERPALAAFSVAGPVRDGAVHLLNNDWRLSAGELCGRFGFDRVVLANDFDALARGLPELGPQDLLTLRPGSPSSLEPAVVGGPGTGFGLAILTADAGGRRTVWGEGGHRAFAPRTEFEWRVFQALLGEYDYVSAEVVAGGKHLAAVHRAVARVMGQSPAGTDPMTVHARAAAGDPVCVAVCRLRAATTLTVLGDVALLAGAARAGVFIAGGESVRLKPFLSEPEALARFQDRGPRTAYLAQTPLHLITGGEAGLIGAAALLL